MLQFKDGVSVDGIQMQTIEMMAILNTWFVLHLSGKPLVVTSCTDGKHMKGSKHYQGLAFDIRTRHLTVDEIKRLTVWFSRSSYNRCYDMVLESDHIHVEYDPR